MTAQEFSAGDYLEARGNTLRFSEAAASRFAKNVAGDFNPLHDVGHKRFCVPGDLLFAQLLDHYGVHSRLTLRFDAMVDAETVLELPPRHEGVIEVRNQRDRVCLSLQLEGDLLEPPRIAPALAHEYVRFSGDTFNILLDLLAERELMLNPARPIAIYRDMLLEMQRGTESSLALVFDQASFEGDGKKGLARLDFGFESDGQRIGQGRKHMAVAGLRPYETDAVNAMRHEFEALRQRWYSQQSATEI